MKIVKVTRRFTRNEWGGIETVILETSKRLTRMGSQVEILTTEALADEPSEDIEGVSIARMPYFYPYLGLDASEKKQMDKAGGDLFSFALLRRLLRMDPPDVIHLHTGKRLGGIGRYAARKQGVPYLVTVHGAGSEARTESSRDTGQPPARALEYGRILSWWVGADRVLADAAAIICVGKREEKGLRERYPGQRIEWIPDGVDMERFSRGDGREFRQKYSLPPQARVILTVGRIDPQKNQLAAIKAMPDILGNEPAAHLVIIGPVTNDDYLSEIHTHLQREDLEDAVTVIKGLDAFDHDLMNAYHAADLFLLPSIHEPFGITILEAWAAGRPVVASGIDGIPFLVHDQVDGLLVNPENPDELAQAVIRILKDRNLARSLARAGNRKARHDFSWEAITERVLALYEEVIRQDRSR